MKQQFGSMLNRFRSSQRTRDARLRKLNMENLEGRRLLAADWNPLHNYAIAEDVNQDFMLSASDALGVVNYLNQQNSNNRIGGAEGEGTDPGKVDVNDDGIVSPLDALLTINAINAEGEGSSLINFTYEITDTSGTPINSATVGQDFRINVFVQDMRDAADATGVFAAAMDLGVTNLDLINYQRNGSFLSGITFGSEYPNDNGANEGGGIQILGGTFPTVSDGQTFTLNAGNGDIQFEFDWDGAIQADTQVITLRDPTGGDALTFTEVSTAMVSTINGSSLGVTSQRNGQGVVGIDLDQVTLTAETSPLGLSQIADEYFNEVKAFANGFSSSDPTGVIPFYSFDVSALSEGTVTFTPGGPDRPGSENLVFGSQTPIPNNMVTFGSPFSLTINADATAPTAADDTLSTPEDTARTIVLADVSGNDTVEPGRTLSLVSIDAIPGTTVGTINGTTYTPPADQFGTALDTFTYTIEDSTGLRATATITMNVTSVNDAPDAIDDTFTVDEDSTDNSLDVLNNDNAGPNEMQTLTVTAVGATSGNGVVTIASGGSAVIYTPEAGFAGEETFTYTISDGERTDTATVTVTVEPLTLPRARTDRPAAFSEDTTDNVIDVLANDAANDGEQAVLLNIASNPSNGTVMIDDNGTTNDQTDDTILYTPNANFFGTDTFTYTMNDTAGTGENSVGTVTVTVTDVNDPVILVDDTAETAEDNALTIAISTLLSNDSPGLGEDASQTLSITAVNAVSATGGSVAIVDSNVVYTPSADFNGSFEFTYTAQDDGTPVESGTATVVVTVTAVNDDPIAVDDQRTAVEDTLATYSLASLTSNDLPGPATATDEAGQELTITEVSQSLNGGSVTIVSGNVEYDPAADFNGEDTFTYTLSDGAGGFDTGTVTINVASVNDAPTAADDSVSGFKDIVLNIPAADLLGNDSPGPANESDQTLSIISIDNTGTRGTAVINSDGSVTFTPEAEFTGNTSFVYTVSDGQDANSTDTATVNVTIEEFQPSTISGIVFVDETQDGVIDDAERRMGGVVIALSGMSFGEPVNQTMMTLADGSYSFDTLGPGTYTVSYGVPGFMLDGMDVPGTLGDTDAVENQFTFEIEQPGGFDASGYNFATIGVEASPGRLIDQLASRFFFENPDLIYSGAYFGIGADNSLLWGVHLDGFDDSVFSEAVVSEDGETLLLTRVDSSQRVFTAALGTGEWIGVTDDAGNHLVRVLGGSGSFAWQEVDLQAPPFTADMYLDAVDAIFAQEGWDNT